MRRMKKLLTAGIATAALSAGAVAAAPPAYAASSTITSPYYSQRAVCVQTYHTHLAHYLGSPSHTVVSHTPCTEKFMSSGASRWQWSITVR